MDSTGRIVTKCLMTFHSWTLSWLLLVRKQLESVIVSLPVTVFHLCSRSIDEFLPIFLHIIWATFRFLNWIPLIFHSHKNYSQFCISPNYNYNINKLLSGVDSWKKHVWLIKCANATQIILYTLIGSILSYNLLLNGTLGKLIKSLLQIWQSISKNLFWLQAMKMTVMISIQIHSPCHMSITSTLSWHWSSHYVATAV